MKGEFIIDGENSYSSFRMLMEQYGYRTVVAVPSLKNIEITEWPDEDGIEADLSAPVLSPKTVSLPFIFCDISLISMFYNLITDGAYHTFTFPELGGFSISLRLQNSPSLASMIHLGKGTMTFVQDNPSVPSAEPYSDGYTRVTQRGFAIDGIDISRYGCWMLDGSIQNIVRAPLVKDNIVIEKSNYAGQTYLPQTDDEGGTAVFFKSKDVSLNLLINARDISEFWRCWNALFRAITAPDERELYIETLQEFYECFYKSSSVNRFDIMRSGAIWCEFTLTLTFLSFRPGGFIQILSTEDGEAVVTEEDMKYIDITPPIFS